MNTCLLIGKVISEVDFKFIKKTSEDYAKFHMK